MRWLGALVVVLGWPVQAWAQLPDKLAAVRAALGETKAGIEGLRMPVYIAREKWDPGAAGLQRQLWTRAEIDSFTVSWLPVLTRKESDLLACDSTGKCRSLVGAVVLRIAEPLSLSATAARVRLIYTHPLAGDLNRTNSSTALFDLERREGAWVVVAAEYSTP